MKRLLVITIIVAGFLLSIAALANAQSIDGQRLNIYGTGASSPTTFFDFASSATVCDLAEPPATTPPAVNPTTAVWNDPVRVGRVCQWTDPGTGPLLALPLGVSYESTLQFFNAAGRGPESARYPFTRLAAPTVAPAGFRLIRPGL